MSVRSLLLDVDTLLHQPRNYSRPKDHSIHLGQLLLAGLLLGIFYGACMGLYALLAPRPEDFPTHDRWLQFLATSLKLPLVFFLTYMICTPSLYVFATLAGSRESPRRIVQILMARNAECLAVVASLGPVAAFFTLSTESYPFMKLLNVLFLMIGGIVLVTRLRATLTALNIDQGTPDFEALEEVEVRTVAEQEPELPIAEEGSTSTEMRGELTESVGLEELEAERLPRTVEQERQAVSRRLLLIFVSVLAIVGGQVSWILRPFLGAPGMEFELFRQRSGNFYSDVLRTLGNLF